MKKKSIILPSVIPVRFPADEELAAAMRALPVMRLARALAGWVGDEPIPIADGWQAPETKLDAARALGLVAEDGTLTDEITRRLNWIYEIAFHAGYLHTEHGAVHRHQALDTATEQTDAQIRTAWDGALNALFAHGVEDLLPEAANPAPLDFHGIGNFPLLAMLEQHGTATVTELSDEIALGATEGMTPSAAEHVWAAWTCKHGDPTRGYLGLAEELGVLKIDGKTATLTPLGTWAMLRQLHNTHLEHLPGSAGLTPYQVLVCRLGMSDEAFGRELECWLTAREPGSPVTELLTEAAAQSDSPRYLRTGVQIAAGISGDTDEAWREALAMPEVRPYAAAELNRRAGRDFWDNPLPGLEPIHCDSAVMSSHGIIAAYEGSKDPAEVARAVREEASRTSEAAMFEEMWRSRHQVAYQALAVIGQHHPDKKTAKAARAALHKASSARLPTAPHGPSSPALEADGLRRHVRSVLQVREAPCRVPELRPSPLTCSFLDQPVTFMPPVRTRGSARRGCQQRHPAGQAHEGLVGYAHRHKPTMLPAAEPLLQVKWQVSRLRPVLEPRRVCPVKWRRNAEGTQPTAGKQPRDGGAGGWLTMTHSLATVPVRTTP